MGLIIKRDENGKYYATNYETDEKERTKNNSNLIKTVPLNTRSAAFFEKATAPVQDTIRYGYNKITAPLIEKAKSSEKIMPARSKTTVYNDMLNAAQKQAGSTAAWDEESLRLNRLKAEHNKLLSFMTDSQKTEYNALADSKRNEYVKSIQDELNRKAGAEEAAYVTGRGKGVASPIGYAGAAGVNNFSSGLKGAWNMFKGTKDTVAKSPMEYAYQGIRPTQKGVGGVASDVMFNTGNMLPSMAIGLINPTAGRAAMFASSAGNSYNDAIEQGYNPYRATNYGVTSGLKEVALSYMLGAIPGISKAENIISKNAENVGGKILGTVIKSEPLRAAASNLVGRMVAEGAEETAQEWLDPALQNMALGQNNNLNFFTDKDLRNRMGYAGFLGGISGGAFNIPGSIGIYNGARAQGTGVNTTNTNSNTDTANSSQTAQEVLMGQRENELQNVRDTEIPDNNENALKENGEILKNDNKNDSTIAENTISVKYDNFEPEILKDKTKASSNFIACARNFFPKSVKVKSNGMDVAIGRNGLDKLLSGNFSKEKYASAFYVPQILENAYAPQFSPYNTPYGSKKENISGYTYMKSNVNIEGVNYIAYIRIRHSNNKNNYYGHTLGLAEVDEIKIEPLNKGRNSETVSSSVNAEMARADVKNTSSPNNGSIDSISDNPENINSLNTETETNNTKSTDNTGFEETRAKVETLKSETPDPFDPLGSNLWNTDDDTNIRRMKGLLDKGKKINSTVVDKAIARVQQDIEASVETLTKEFWAYKPQGTSLIEDSTNAGESILTERKRISNNEKWYSDLYKKYKRKPTKAQMADYARELVENDVRNTTGEYVDPNISKAYNYFNGLKNTLSKLGSAGLTLEEYIKFTENPISANGQTENTSTYGENTVGSAQMNPNSTRAQLDNLAEQYGAIEDGESPRVRAANIPNSTDGETQVSKFARTLIETPNTPDILVPELENAILKGKFSHEVMTDKKAKSYAYDVIEKQGYEAAYQKWRNALNDHESGQKRIGKSDTALATALYNEACDAAAKGDTSAARVAMQIASDLVEVYTEAGQVVQSARLMKSMTPQGQLYSLQKLAERISSKRKAKGRSQGKDITINEEMAQELLQAETEAETETAVNKIKTDMAQQIGANLADVINEWRYFCMLANPKTHIRNIVGNGATQAMYSVKDVVGTALESVTDKVSRAKGGQGLETRTKAILNPLSRTDTELRNFAKKDFETNGKNFTDATSKYNENGDILSRRNVWKNNPVGEAIIKKVPAMEAVFNGIDKAAKFNTNMLDAEDTAFIKLNYTRALAEYMKANGIDIQKAATAEMAQKMQDGRLYAANQAMEATFHDDNVIADALNKFQQANTITKLAVGATMPFKKTPLNILRRSYEYSPVGAAIGVKNFAGDIKNGNVSQSQIALDQLAKGFTGTGLMAIGIWAASKGILNSIIGSDDEKERGLKLAQGEQDFAAKIGGKSFTLDSFAPAAIPLLMGAQLYETFTEKQDVTPGDIVDALSSMSEPVIEMSVLSSLDDMLTTLQYASSGSSKMQAMAGSVAKNYAGQMLPTAMSALSNTIDDTKRSTYVDKNSPLGYTGEGIVQSAKYKIPSEHSKLEPALDVWGRETVNKNAASRAINNFLNPISVKEINSTEADKEIQAIYDATGDSGVIPKKPSKYFKIDGERKDLTAKEYTKYVKMRNNESYNDIEDMIGNPLYAQLSDEDKAKVIEGIYAHNDRIAKNAIDSRYEIESGDQKILDMEEAGFNTAEAVLIKQTLANIDARKDIKQADKNNLKGDFIENSGYTTAQKNLIGELYVNYGQFIPSDKVIDYSSHESRVISNLSATGQWIWENDFKARGISPDTYGKIYKAVSSGKNAEKIAELQLMGYTYDEAKSIVSMYSKAQSRYQKSKKGA